MKHPLVLTFAMLLMMGSTSLSAQKFFTKTGEVNFTSVAPLEKIEAENNAATCVIDFASGQMQMAVLIKAFKFEKALMQEHFNENYMESSKYPKGAFKGKITGMKATDLQKDGQYAVKVVGDLTIHGQTKAVSTPGSITVKGDKVTAVASFSVKLEDYKIEVPSVVRDKIAKDVSIDVNLALAPLGK